MLRSLTAVTSPYFLLMWSSVTPAILRFSFPPSLGRCKGVLARAEIGPSTERIAGLGCASNDIDNGHWVERSQVGPRDGRLGRSLAQPREVGVVTIASADRVEPPASRNGRV